VVGVADAPVAISGQFLLTADTGQISVRLTRGITTPIAPIGGGRGSRTVGGLGHTYPSPFADLSTL
jgi:hypothetical protein